MGRALTLFTFKYTSDTTFHEGRDGNKFIPDGVNVAYVLSNFQSNYHKDYLYLTDKPPEKIKSNRGRKCKPKKPKILKRDNGDNTKFSCNIIIGVIVADEIYNMKIFRCNSGNISSIKVNDIELVKLIIDKAIVFMNTCMPELNIKIQDINLGLRNLRQHHIFPESNYTVNVYLMSQEMKKINCIKLNDKDVEIKNIIFNNDEIYMRMSIMYKDTRFQSKIYPNGDIYIYGGNDDDIANQIAKFIENMFPRFYQIGYKSISKNESTRKIKEHLNSIDDDLLIFQ